MKLLKNWILLTAIGFLLAAVLPNGGQFEPKEYQRQSNAKSVIIKEMRPFDKIPTFFKMNEIEWNYKYVEKPAYVENIYSTNADSKEIFAEFSRLATNNGWTRIGGERQTGKEKMIFSKKVLEGKGDCELLVVYDTEAAQVSYRITWQP
ncbi:hypothetical protein [Azotosporobacter soli]|uniref:hypothetical protein n=1 Tax=Azotosporobacter soli TaxID=3055040 RepID=UPI0031FF1BC0